jgi:hypothetical protein
MGRAVVGGDDADVAVHFVRAGEVVGVEVDGAVGAVAVDDEEAAEAEEVGG